jgi:hypothetical protein
LPAAPLNPQAFSTLVWALAKLRAPLHKRIMALICRLGMVHTCTRAYTHTHTH